MRNTEIIENIKELIVCNKRDDENIFDFLLNKRLSFFLYDEFFKMGLKDNDKSRNVFDRQKKQAVLQMSELDKISKILSENNIPFLVVKGLVLSKILWDNAFFRDSGDIDIIVARERMEEVYWLLYKEGYRFFEGIQNNTIITSEEPMLLYSDDYQEFRCIKEINQCRIKVEIKCTTSAIPEKDIYRYWKETQSIDLEGIVP